MGRSARFVVIASGGVILPRISGVQQLNFPGRISEEISDEERTI